MLEIKYNQYNSIWPIVNRHWRTSWPFLNFTKLSNIGLAKIYEITGRKKINSRPYFIKIEPTNRCMLKCSGCLHSAGREQSSEDFPLGDMDFELFKKIIDQQRRYLVKVSLYSEGEPLVYSRIAEMVEYLSNRNIASVISSNFNYLTPELAGRLVESRLTHLIVCLDGYDRDSYKNYREGGDFDRVIANLKLIQAEKKKRKSKLPYLEIQTIRLPNFTELNIRNIRRIAKDLQADYFLVKDDLSKYYKQPKPQSKKCFWLYSSPQFKWNGIVQPCCYYYNDKANDFGDANRETVANIWNNEKYQAARMYFENNKTSDQDLRCYNCNFFRQGFGKTSTEL